MLNLNFMLKIDVEDYILEDVRNNIRYFLLEKCTGNFYILYGPSSMVNSDGQYVIFDRSYLIIFFENEKDLLLFKIKWME